MSNLRIFIIKTMFPELPASQNKIQNSTSITSILHFVTHIFQAKKTDRDVPSLPSRFLFQQLEKV